MNCSFIVPKIPSKLHDAVHVQGQTGYLPACLPACPATVCFGVHVILSSMFCELVVKWGSEITLISRCKILCNSLYITFVECIPHVSPITDLKYLV
jgi:hypothetical protein